jgi:hypothetical protein
VKHTVQHADAARAAGWEKIFINAIINPNDAEKLPQARRVHPHHHRHRRPAAERVCLGALLHPHPYLCYGGPGGSGHPGFRPLRAQTLTPGK